MRQRVEEVQRDGDVLTYPAGGWHDRDTAVRILSVLAGLFGGLCLYSIGESAWSRVAIFGVFSIALVQLARSASSTKAMVVVDRKKLEATCFRCLQASGQERVTVTKSIQGARYLLLEREGREAAHRGTQYWYSLVARFGPPPTADDAAIEGGSDRFVELGARASRERMHNIAEKMAAFLQLPLVDRSTGDEICRTPEQLDESLRDRALRLKERPSLPATPPSMTFEHDTQGKAHFVSIPAPGFAGPFGLIATVGLLTTIVFIAAYIAPSFAEDDSGTLGTFLFALPIVLGALYYSLDAIQIATCQDEVTITPREVSVAHGSLLGEWTESIPASELEEVTVATVHSDGSGLWSMGTALAAAAHQREVLLRSDQRSLSLGRGASRTELDWLRQLVAHVVTS